MNEILEEFYRPRDRDRRPFAGQLDPAFQEQLRAAHAGVTEQDCHFYHTLDLGDGRVIPGGWDIRGNEPGYLGHIRFQGLRVLEFGAASGYLTFWMESQGAKVVALDLPPGHPPDLVPLPGVDLASNAGSGAVTARQVRNSWWFGHRARGSKAEVVYADIYRLPGDLGRFDVSTFGSILLHLENPFSALREAAAVTDRAIIVTDLLPDLLYGDEHNSLMEFNPGEESSNLVNWWRSSPGAITRMLRVLGFPHVDIHYCENRYHPYHKTDAPPVTRFMFTAVGQRDRGAVPRLDLMPAEVEADRRLRAAVPVINTANYNDAHRRLQEAIAQLETIQNSRAWRLIQRVRGLLGRRTG